MRLRAAGVVALAVAGGLLLPAIPFFIGAFLVVAVALHAGSSTLRPFLEPVLRVPIAAPARRRAHLLVIGGAGVLLFVAGSVGARINGRLRSEVEQRGRLHELADRQLDDLLQRAQHHIAAGYLEEAELVLLNAQETVAADAGRTAEVDELLAQVRRRARP